MADSLPSQPEVKMADSLPPRPQPAVRMAHYSLPPLPAVRMADSLPPPQPAAKMADWTAFEGCTGFLKIVTLIFGLLSVGLTADSYQYNLSVGNPMESSYLVIVIIIFIASVLWSLLLVVVIPVSDLRKRIDLVFHLFAGGFLIGSAAVWFVSVDEHFMSGTYKPLVGGDINFDKRPTTTKYEGSTLRTVGNSGLTYNTERLAAGVFGMMNGFVYIIIGFCLC